MHSSNKYNSVIDRPGIYLYGSPHKIIPVPKRQCNECMLHYSIQYNERTLQNSVQYNERILQYSV